MDYQNPPEIVIQAPAEHHKVAEEVIEHVARLLARAEGIDPDHDDRCTSDANGLIATCTLQPYIIPAWGRYRDRAVELLRSMFVPPVAPSDPCSPLPVYPLHCTNPAGTKQR